MNVVHGYPRGSLLLSLHQQQSVVQRGVMVLYSTGVPFTSAAVCEVQALMKETDRQFNNSYSALLGGQTLSEVGYSRQTQTNTHKDVHKCSFIHKEQSEVKHPTTAVHK